MALEETTIRTVSCSFSFSCWVLYSQAMQLMP